MAEKFDTLTELLHGALGDQVAQSDDFLDLFAENAVFEFPFAPTGTPERLEGKVAIAQHAHRLAPVLEFGELTLGPVYRSGDTTVFEAFCQGRGVEAGLPYDQKYICIVKLQDKKIVRYQDFWNPLVLISALGGQEAMIATYAK